MDTNNRDEPTSDGSAAGFQSSGSDVPRRIHRKNRRARASAGQVRGWESTDGAPPLTRELLESVRAAFASLNAASRALARSRGLEGVFHGIEVRMRLGNGQHPDSLSSDFLREILSRLDEAQAAEEFVVPNHAYCLRCESFLCAHSRPRDAREVLAGYEPTGRPRWADFLTMMFERRDERSESVADRTSGIVTILTSREDLTRDRIIAFGGEQPEVEVLCQLAAGLFPMRSNNGIDEESAVTIQFLKVRTPGGAKLVLHTIGDPRLLNSADAACDPDLVRILSTARSLARKRATRGERNVDAAFVKIANGLTHDLSRDLQHHFHVRSRRTVHARERAAIGIRPTSHAFPEARVAVDGDIRIDRAAGTFVLLGKNSRVHFFNREGRHVTSVRFNGETIRARLDTGRWRPAEPAEIAQFRARVSNVPNLGNGDDHGRK